MKKFFKASFDPKMQPGYQSRFKTLDSLMGKTFSESPEESCPNLDGGENLREKFRSGQVRETLPTARILRPKGKT